MMVGGMGAMQDKRRVVVGISGASGAIYGVRALKMLKASGVESHLIISKAARLTIRQELRIDATQVEDLADEVHQVGNVGAACASGSFMTSGMLVAPCSIKTMSEIATGVTSNLLSRSADVMLKERRRLVLMLRETPLHLGHIRTMAAVTEMGAIVYPPVPALYVHPSTIEQMVDHTIGRVLDLFGIDTGSVNRWRGLALEAPGRIDVGKAG
jgi:4-hydroxy-3-polyprenylbenzoate decarboxylase